MFKDSFRGWIFWNTYEIFFFFYISVKKNDVHQYEQYINIEIEIYRNLLKVNINLL